MSREITSHKLNGLNDALRVEAIDEPGDGGACNHYRITRMVFVPVSELPSTDTCEIKFQNGPIGEEGANGISNEALLAIVEDRLVGFQTGKFSHLMNVIALLDVRSAMNALHRRTADLVERGVEGTHQV